jgi:hypothetical protein
MPTATPLTEPAVRRASDGSDPSRGLEAPPMGQVAPRTPIRRTDERGRPLSIFAAHRQRGKVDTRDARRRADELEAAVRSWSAAPSLAIREQSRTMSATLASIPAGCKTS